jgi:hypothetical protein
MYETAGSGTFVSSTSDTNIRLHLINNVSTAAGDGFGAMLFLHRPGDGATNPSISGNFNVHSGSSTVGSSNRGGVVIGARNAVIVLDRINFLFASGNVATGRLTVWGIAHA